MTAVNKQMVQQQPSEIEMLLPFHAAGTLNKSDARLVEEALARDTALARQYAVIREEYAETIRLNESLGAPSVGAMHKLFTAIEAEPARKPRPALHLIARLKEVLASLSPRTLAWSAAVGAVALLLQAGIIGAMLTRGHSASYETASLSKNQSITPDLGSATPPRALVRFAPEARLADVTALLESYQASIVDGASGGMFRVQFGDRPLPNDEVARLMNRLQREKIVTLAVTAQ